MYEELIQILNSLCIDAVELKNDALLDKCLDARWKAKCLPEIQGTGVVVNNQEWDIPIGT